MANQIFNIGPKKSRFLEQQLAQAMQAKPKTLFGALGGLADVWASKRALGKAEDAEAERQTASNELLAGYLASGTPGGDMPGASPAHPVQGVPTNPGGAEGQLAFVRANPDLLSDPRLMQTLQLAQMMEPQAAEPDTTQFKAYFNPKTGEQKAARQGSEGAAALVEQGYVPGKPPSGPQTVVNVGQTGAGQEQLDLLKRAEELREGGDERGARVVEEKAAGKATDAQGKAAGFADRIAQAEEVLSSLGEDGQPIELQGTSWVGNVLEMVPFGNYGQSADYQRSEQARRNFINATLRRESGAVINPDEFDNAEKQYFPRPGDNAAVIEQKRQNRKAVLNSMRRDAGPLYEGGTAEGMSGTSTPVPDEAGPEAAPLSNDYSQMSDAQLDAIDLFGSDMSTSMLEMLLAEKRRRK